MTASRHDISTFLNQLAEELDIPESRLEQAERSYLSIGQWLSRGDSRVVHHSPQIYAQGSFRLGTPIKPLTDAEEYDIDLVCEVELTKQHVSQKALKDLIGEEITSYCTARGMKNPPTEGRRCWTLNYAEGAQFHMDILPAIPDGMRFSALLEASRLANQWSGMAISITDTEHPFFGQVSEDWLGSNPKGYAEWFKERMRPRLNEQVERLAKSLARAIEDIPDFIVRTPLQRAIQLLKRHRDGMFVDDPDQKPISIIITTLAAQAYENQPDLLDTLECVVNRMAGLVQVLGGEKTVINPVNPLENFADKWRDNPLLEVNFANWVKRVQADLRLALEAQTIEGFEEAFQPRFGGRAVAAALEMTCPSLPRRSPAIIVPRAPASALVNVPHRQPPNWPIVQRGTVTIEATVTRDGFRPKLLRSDASSVDKHSSLRFEAQTNVLRPYKVYWQVVNTGEEARLAQNLRGGFYEGILARGGLSRTETTLYRGQHWVECFIVKDGECAARSGEFIVNIA